MMKINYRYCILLKIQAELWKNLLNHIMASSLNHKLYIISDEMPFNTELSLCSLLFSILSYYPLSIVKFLKVQFAAF